MRRGFLVILARSYVAPNLGVSLSISFSSFTSFFLYEFVTPCLSFCLSFSTRPFSLQLALSLSPFSLTQHSETVTLQISATQHPIRSLPATVAGSRIGGTRNLDPWAALAVHIFLRIIFIGSKSNVYDLILSFILCIDQKPWQTPGLFLKQLFSRLRPWLDYENFELIFCKTIK